MLAAVPNPAVLLSPLTTQEAVLSSKIEGTQATMGEVLEFEAGEEAKSSEHREDIREIQKLPVGDAEGRPTARQTPALRTRVARCTPSAAE